MMIIVIATIRAISIVTEVALVATTSTPTTVVSATIITIVVVVGVIPTASSTISSIVAIIIVSVVVISTTASTTATVVTLVAAIVVVIVVVTIASVSAVIFMGVVSLRVGVMDQRPICILHVTILRGTTILSFAFIGSLCVCTNLITDLSTSSAAAKLPMRLEAVVPVDTNHTTIEHGSVQCVHCNGCFSPRRILNKAEATWLHFDAVQSHDKVDDLATGGEKLEQLALKCEERQVTHVQSRRCLETHSVIFFCQIYWKQDGVR